MFASKKAKTAGFHADYATHDDFCEVFEKDMKLLYLLAFLLTANHRESEQCFASTVEEGFKEQAVFRERLRSWVKLGLIRNAVRIVLPASIRNDPKRNLWSASQPSTQGACEIDIVTKLAAFERFVFVMSILERYSTWDCSLLLGCSMSKVAQARMRALRRLPGLAALLPRRDGQPLRRLDVTA